MHCDPLNQIDGVVSVRVGLLPAHGLQ